jgi:uncharacterized protein YeeX (DUF496 family)
MWVSLSSFFLIKSLMVDERSKSVSQKLYKVELKAYHQDELLAFSLCPHLTKAIDNEEITTEYQTTVIIPNRVAILEQKFSQKVIQALLSDESLAQLLTKQTLTHNEAVQIVRFCREKEFEVKDQCDDEYEEQKLFSTNLPHTFTYELVTPNIKTQEFLTNLQGKFTNDIPDYVYRMADLSIKNKELHGKLQNAMMKGGHF